MRGVGRVATDQPKGMDGISDVKFYFLISLQCLAFVSDVFLTSRQLVLESSREHTNSTGRRSQKTIEISLKNKHHAFVNASRIHLSN